MAGDTNSNIFINIDTSQAMAQLRALEKELTALNRALIVGTKTAAQAQARYTQGLLHNVNATGQWTASTVRMSTASEQFATALDRSKLSLKEYFRYGMASTRTFGRVFGSEFDTVSKLVQKRVKTLQQQYVQLGRDASGAMNAVRLTPKNLNYRDVTTQLMMATQRQQIFNKLLDDGSTKLLNFGKNTQWAGRQLMVGFTIPLVLFGTQAIRAFKEIETQTIRFKKVYGDIFTDQGATDEALKNIRALADEYTKYGLKVSETVKMSADAAAAGFTGKALEDLVEQTNKLAVLGGIAQDKALETTIALRNAFRVDEGDLKGTIDFLNAVENQTVLALEDVTEAIPRVGPIIKQLGGNVQDLAFFLTAMKEGGVSAAQGANALKSGLASLINPSNKASKAAAELGINIKGIIEANQGNLRNTVIGFAKALEPLEELQRTRIIEQVFGKFQFARISALLNNITDEGTQAARVLDLTNRSTAELALLAERELGVAASSAMNKFAGAIERLKAGIAPIGEVFAKTLTPIIEFITKMAERFNKLPDGMKKAIAIIIAIVGGLGPVFLMTFGLLANALANALKGFNLLRKGYQNLAYGSSDAALKTQYLTNEELENISVTNALYSSHDRLSAAYKLESTALGALIAQYTSATTAMRNFSVSNPGLFIPGRGQGVPPIRRVGGGPVSGPGTATSDSIPAYLSDGEYVVNAKAVDAYGVETFDALNARKLAAGGPAMRNGIPRLFTGGWMSRVIQNMMPRTRMGIVPTGVARADFSALEGMTGAVGGGLTRTRLSSPFILSETTDGKVKVSLASDSDSFFYINSNNKSKVEERLSSYLPQKTREGLTQSELDDIAKRMVTRNRQRLGGKTAQGETLDPSYIFKSLPGWTQASPSASKSAPPPVRKAFFDAAEANPYSKAGILKAELDEEINFLKKTKNLTREDKATIAKYMTVDVSHLDSNDRFLWSVRTGSRDLGVINKAINYESGLFGKSSHITTTKEAEEFYNYLVREQARRAETRKPMRPTQRAALLILKRRLQNKFYDRQKITDEDLGLEYSSYRTDPETKKYFQVNEYAMGGLVKPRKYFRGTSFVGMPTAFEKVQKGRMLAQQIDARVRSSRFREMAPTDFGVKMKDTSGHSFPIPGVGGIYRKPNGDLVFVKPVMDEKAALAEQRATIIARRAHGLNAPKQTIRTMIDPTDLTRKRKFLVLESPYDSNIGKGGKEFTKDQYFKQLVASTLRGDKDLSPSNVFGGTLADVGTAGVFSRASGQRDFSFNMPSMAEQAMTNLLGIKGGAKRAFAENTADMIKKMNPATYREAMIKEIDAVLPRLKDTVKSFGLTGVEKVLYERMIDRLEAGRKVDWTKYHAIHSKVKPKEYSTGVFSVPGPKGAGDVVPAMLSPGESVIPTAQTQKYQPLIRSIIADKVPGFGTGNPNVDAWGDIIDDKPKQAQKGSMRYALNYLRPSNIVASARAGSLGSQIGAAAREVSIATARATATGAKKAGKAALTVADKRMQAFMADNTEELKNNTKATEDGSEKTMVSTKQQQKNERQQKMMMRTQKMMMPSMGLAMAGPMLAMSQQQKNPEGFIGRNADAIMMGTIAASILLPLINNLRRGLIAGVAALGIAVYLHRKSIENAISESVAFGNALTNTVKTLEAFGAVTGRVSATQVQAEKRAQRMTGLSPYDLSFGADFLKGEAGQEFRKQFIKSTEGLTSGNATDILSSRLAQAVSQNVLSYDEAESFGLAIARSLNDANMELSVVANLRQILGPNGQDLTKNPLDVQMRLIANNKQLNDQFFGKINAAVEKEFGISRKEIPYLIGGAAVGGLLGAGAGAVLRNKLVGKGTRGAAGSVATAKSAYQSSLVARGAAPVVSSIRAPGLSVAATKTLSTASKALLGLRAAGIGATATGGGAVIGVPAIIASIAAEQLVRYFQRGQERKEVGKVAGTLVGSGTGSIRDIGMGISSIREAADIKVQQLENELAMTKEAQKRLEIEKQINNIKTQEDADVESLTKSRQESLNQMLAYRDSIQDKGARKIFDDSVGIQTKQRIKGLEGYQKTEAENLKLYMMGGAFTSGKGKASPEQLAAAQAKIDEALAQIKPGVVDLQQQQKVTQLINEKQKLENQKFDTGRLSAQIQFLLNAEMGVTDAQVLSLLKFAERTEQNPQYYIDIIAGLEDPAAITGIIKDFMDNDNSIQVFLDIVAKEKDKKGGVTKIKNLTQGVNEFIKAKKGLADEYGDNAIDIDNLFKEGGGYKKDVLFGENGIINSQNLTNSKDEIQRISTEMGKINTKLDKAKWSKATAAQRKQMLLDIKESYKDSNGNVLPNKTIDDAIANWDKISTLDRNVQLQAVFTTQVIGSAEMQDEVRNAIESAFIKEVPSRRLMKLQAPDQYTKEFEAWAIKNADKVRKIAETFEDKTLDVLFAPGGVLNPNTADPNSLNNGDGKFEAFKKELRMLNAKRDALRDINSELDRQYQYTQKQMQLMSQAVQAKISGNYIGAAILQQQSISEGAKFARESQEIQLSRLIEMIEGRKVRAEDRGKYNKRDLGIKDKLGVGDFQSLSPMPLTPAVGLGSRASGSQTIGGTVYNINMPITGVNDPNKAAALVEQKLRLIANKNNRTNRVAI